LLQCAQTPRWAAVPVFADRTGYEESALVPFEAADIWLDPEDEPQGPEDDNEYEPLDLVQIEEAELLGDPDIRSD